MTSIQSTSQIMQNVSPLSLTGIHNAEAISVERRQKERRAISQLEEKRIAEQFIQSALVLCPEWQDVYNLTGYAGLCDALACEVESYGIRGSLSDALLTVMAGAVLAST